MKIFYHYTFLLLYFMGSFISHARPLVVEQLINSAQKLDAPIYIFGHKTQVYWFQNQQNMYVLLEQIKNQHYFEHISVIGGRVHLNHQNQHSFEQLVLWADSANSTQGFFSVNQANINPTKLLVNMPTHFDSHLIMDTLETHENEQYHQQIIVAPLSAQQLNQWLTNYLKKEKWATDSIPKPTRTNTGKLLCLHRKSQQLCTLIHAESKQSYLYLYQKTRVNHESKTQISE